MSGSSAAVFDVFYMVADSMMAPSSLSSIELSFTGNVAGVTTFSENAMVVSSAMVVSRERRLDAIQARFN